MKSPHSLILLSCFLLLAVFACQNDAIHQTAENAIQLDDDEGRLYDPVIDPGNFVSTIDNPYFTLTPGRSWTYEKKKKSGKIERVEVEVTNDTRVVMGVTTTVVRDRVWKNGELVEDTFDWFAQDTEGNVWYFGEDSKTIKDGQVVSLKGSWQAGVDGAKPGIIMKANPEVGDAYRNEMLMAKAEDMAEVLDTNVSVNIGSGPYKNCLQTKDWSPLEPHMVEHKFYSKEVGNVIMERKIGKPGQLELVSFQVAEGTY